MHTNSVIELNPDSYQNNLLFLKKMYGKNVILSSVVKGNAYGHGIEEFVTMAHKSGVSHFSVFDVAEAQLVKKQLPKKVTILIMGFVSDELMEWVIQNDIEFFVFDKKRIELAIKISKKLNKKAIVHIEVETGMNRTGFVQNELNSLISLLKKEENHIEFKGLCTHFAGAESMSNYFRVKQQIERFEKIYAYFCVKNLIPKIKHSACSAASIMFPETRMDMVRIGIMQYGLWPSPEVFASYISSKKKKIDPLKRVISWKSQVMSIKKIDACEFIGYGTSFMAKEKMKIATIPIGYAHGYSRSLSNKGRVIINQHRCMVVGTVNMNMMLVDVSDIPSIQIGDEVILIGSQEKIDVSVASFSENSNQLNYELLTRISKSIPRKILI
ncbi:MAG TPA: alanine racemase [Flavobacterium sp.]|uniref:alanine racemase n=1 Tax=unclassified Flavobacterium TaxID=196869 RepID=UPI000E82BD6D|nr:MULTISPECIES: alanine racemase [unclassified Flavobacterium]HBI02069.1 alanine racemase [Flavobacterium sp.]HRE77130.1 alanine racemase [Flavobacterium sp.]